MSWGDLPDIAGAAQTIGQAATTINDQVRFTKDPASGTIYAVSPDGTMHAIPAGTALPDTVQLGQYATSNSGARIWVPDPVAGSNTARYVPGNDLQDNGTYVSHAAITGPGNTAGTVVQDVANGIMQAPSAALAGLSGAGKAVAGALGALVPDLGTAGVNTAIKGINTDVGEARNLSAQFAANLDNAQPRPAPVITAPTVGRASTIGTPNLPNAAQTAGTTLGPVANATAAQAAGVTLGPAAQAQAQQAKAATLGAAPTYQAAQVAPAAQAAAGTANAAQIQTADQAATRAKQQALAQALEAQANGTGGPSPAELMLNRALERNNANQAGFAASAMGSQIGGAQRTAAINAANSNAQSMEEQAILRAQEQQAARAQLAGVLESTRGADIGLATGQAGLTNTVNLANLTAGQQAALANAAAINTAAGQQAQLTTGAAEGSAQLQAANQLAQGQLSQGANLANLSAAQQTALANQGATNTQSLAAADIAQKKALADQDALNRALLANAGAANTQNIAQGQLTQQTGLANTAATNARVSEMGQLTEQTALANQAAMNQALMKQLDLTQQSAIENAANVLKARGYDDAQIQAYISAALQGNQQAIGGDIGAANAAAMEAAAKAKLAGDVLSGLATGGATLLMKK